MQGGAPRNAASPSADASARAANAHAIPPMSYSGDTTYTFDETSSHNKEGARFEGEGGPGLPRAEVRAPLPLVLGSPARQVSEGGEAA